MRKGLMRMKYDCEVIKDLLPLYQDNVCSKESRRMVEEHLEECIMCGEVASQLRNDTIDNELLVEKGYIIDAHEKKEKKRTFVIGSVIAGILMIPLVVCLICNLATGNGLTWFFIVLASLLVTATVTVLPLFLSDYRFTKSVLAFCGSLVILLYVCCVYTGGDWFLLASVPTVYGILLITGPIILHELPLKKPFSNMKGLISLCFDTVFLYGVLFVIGDYCLFGEKRWNIMMVTAAVSAIVVWVFFLMIRYIGINRWCKAGIISVFVGVVYGIISNIVDYLLDKCDGVYLTDVDLLQWEDVHINANINILVLCYGAVIGLILLSIGIAQIIHKNRLNHNINS